MDLGQEISRYLEDGGEKQPSYDRTRHRARAPQHAHENGIEGPVQAVETLGLDGEDIVGENGAAHAREKGRDGKGEDLELQDIDAARLSGRLVVPDGDEGKPYVGPCHVEYDHDCENREGKGYEVVGQDGAEGRRGKENAHGSPGKSPHWMVRSLMISPRPRVPRAK